MVTQFVLSASRVVLGILFKILIFFALTYEGNR